MTQPASGLLPALIGYYHRLSESQSVADFGFSVEKIHFCVVLELDGTRFAFEDIRERNDRGKPFPRSLLVPDGGGRSGTGLKPFFCWDNTGYALGRDNKGKPERAADMFAAFRDLHLSFRDELAGDAGFTALCRFLERWEPARAEQLPSWEEAAGLNVVFKLRGREGYVHQGEAVRSAWSRRVAAQGEDGPGVTGVSLVDGEEGELARLHPQVSGVAGANTSGAALVSFNKGAFESYGKSQSYNAPVGTHDAFRYTTALNCLLADRTRSTRIGDATVVFWSDRADGVDAEEVFRQIFGKNASQDEPAEHAVTVDRVRSFLDAAQRGLLSDRVQNPDAPFYVLGLSPNAARLNVRFWLTGTVQQFAERLARHAADLQIGGQPSDQPLMSIQAIIAETSRRGDSPSPLLAGSVARAILEGLPSFPEALLNAVVRRIRADGEVPPLRAAILKAYLIRNLRKEVPVALDKDHPDEAYQLGRLFAALEFAQTSALSDINGSVKDAYFGAAAATPALVFPRLMKLHNHHLEKLPTGGEQAKRKKKRTKGFFERLVQEICSHVRQFPTHLSLERQGLFYIAYYHQRQDFFTKKTENDKETTDE